MFKRIFGRKKDKALDTALPPPPEDPVRQILAVPRGIARLDAFERVLDDLEAYGEAAKPVALAYRKELLSLASKAQIDLGLLADRAERCAQALLDAGAVEKAGALLAKIGKRKRAAEIFVEVGEIEQLELLHADEDLEREGGTRLSARLAYDRFEGLFAVGLRKEALSALEEAARLWPDNPVYGEIARRFRERVPRERVVLKIGDARVTFSGTWPLSLGRGEGSVLSLSSPLISREHVEIGRDKDAVFVRDIQGRGDVFVDDTEVRGARALEGQGKLLVGGVGIGFHADAQRLLLWAEQAPDVKAAGLLARGAINIDGSELPLSFDNEGRAQIEATKDGRRLTVDGQQVKNGLLLLRGDQVTLGELRFRVL